MNAFELRTMTPADRSDVAELICLSTNVWYQTHGRPLIFAGGPASTTVFFDVYEALDPGCGVVAVSRDGGRIVGSCFYHPRPTHVSLGIMNVHPNYFGAGIARAILQHIIQLAQREGKPVRLVSSAMNLDSFSLYTRAGFVPQTPYQDMVLSVPAEGLALSTEGDRFVRAARPEDVPAMVALEMEIAGISREKDFRYFLENRAGFWHTSVWEQNGRIEGFMVSSGHPGCNMIGPGAARNHEQIASLLLAELRLHKGRTPVFLVPVQCGPLVARMYQWGATNCEMHFSQSHGPAKPLTGLHMPTFLPETS
jgi:GNAT superfamily N-acetyltransferase